MDNQLEEIIQNKANVVASTNKPTLELNHAKNPPFNLFRNIQLVASNGVIYEALANIPSLEQIIFKIKDKRLEEKDVRQHQCITFIKDDFSKQIESRNNNSNSLINIWDFYKILQNDYKSSIAFYFEGLNIKLDLFKLINRSLVANKKSISFINSYENVDIKLELVQKSKRLDYGIILNKKKGNDVSISFGQVGNYLSSNMANMLHKLQGNKRDLNPGINFINNVAPVKRHIEPGLTPNHLKMIIESLIRSFQPEDQDQTPRHISTTLIQYKNDAQLNNNKCFTKIFEFLDLVRDFYHKSLLFIFDYLFQLADQTTTSSLLDKQIELHPNILTQLAEILAQTAPMDLAICIFFNLNRDNSSQTHITSHSIIKACESRLVNYETIFKIYDNIFVPQNSNVTDYHVILNNEHNLTFIHLIFRIFLQANPKYLVKMISIQEDKANPGIIPIDLIYYPKKK